MSQRTLVLVVFYGLTVFLLQLRPNHDVDLFWRVKTGELMLERGELIRTDQFTATHAHEPVPPIGCLSDVFYAVLYRIGSWRLLSQVNALVFAGALLIAALTVRRQETSTFASLLGLSLGLLVAMPHCATRPQSFAIFGFALLLLVAEAEIRAWWKLVLAGLILLIWQNMHPSVILAAIVLGARAGAGWLRLLRDRRAAKPWVATVIALLAVLSTVATPMGLSIFATSARNAQIARELGVAEWMPLWHQTTRAAAPTFWIPFAISLLLLIRLRRRVRLEDLATFVVLAGITLPVYRFSLFFAVAMVPVWSRWIALAWSGVLPAQGQSAEQAPPLHCGVILAVLLLALIAPRLMCVPLFDRQLPLAGIERLRELGVRGVIYNYREWGGPLIWAGYPNWKVTIDGRLYLFTPEDWRRYNQIALGQVPVARVEQWYKPKAFFLRPSYHKRFIKLLQQSNNWKETFADENAAVFTRSGNAKPQAATRQTGLQPRPTHAGQVLP